MKKHSIILLIVSLILMVFIITSCGPAKAKPEYDVNEVWQTFRSDYLALIEVKQSETPEEMGNYIAGVKESCSSNYAQRLFLPSGSEQVIDMVRGLMFYKNLHGITIDGDTATGKIPGGGVIIFTNDGASWKINGIK